MLKVTLSKAFPTLIVSKKDKKERKIWKPKKLFKGDHNPVAAAVISWTYLPDGPLKYVVNIWWIDLGLISLQHII